MAEVTHTATTEVPEGSSFPPFDTTTFPSQLFWLAVTFAFLFTVLWKVAGPRINGAITNRRGVINGAIKEAATARSDAEAAQAAYEASVKQARDKAHALAEETRQTLNAEIAKAKAEADTASAAAMASANAQIGTMRETAKAHVTIAARDAAIAIVERLTGDRVSAEDAAQAIGNKAIGN